MVRTPVRGRSARKKRNVRVGSGWFGLVREGERPVLSLSKEPRRPQTFSEPSAESRNPTPRSFDPLRMAARGYQFLLSNPDQAKEAVQ